MPAGNTEKGDRTTRGQNRSRFSNCLLVEKLHMLQYKRTFIYPCNGFGQVESGFFISPGIKGDHEDFKEERYERTFIKFL